MERWCDDNDTMVWWWWCDGTIVRWRWCDDMTMVRWLWGNIFYRTIVIASSHHGAIDFFADKLFPRIWSQMWVFFISETLIFLAYCCKMIKNVSNDFFCLEINLKKKLSVEYGNSYQGEGVSYIIEWLCFNDFVLVVFILESDKHLNDSLERWRDGAMTISQ